MNYLKLSVLSVTTTILIIIAAQQFTLFQTWSHPALAVKIKLIGLIICTAIFIYATFLCVLKVVNEISMRRLHLILKSEYQLIYRKYDRYYLNRQILKEYQYPIFLIFLLSQKELEELQNTKFG